MKIAITVDPEIPVPPLEYGGIERIVALLVRGLVDLGHEITVFAHRGSELPCELVPYPGLSSVSRLATVQNMSTIAAVLSKRQYDLIHSFGRLMYLLPFLPARIPKLMSYQRHVASSSISWGKRLSRGTLHFSSCSRYIAHAFSSRATSCHVVYNAVSATEYKFRPSVPTSAPLVFLGRIEAIKGVHLAIEVARRTCRQLIIAGNIPDSPEHAKYFHTQVQPFVDGDNIQYVGPVNDSKKNELLGRAAAMLMPILWDEPFGIVMVEALACGTPVIGLRRGAVPEVIEDGITGFIADDVDGMVNAVGRITSLERFACRTRMESRFSGAVMTSEYVRVYRRLLEANA